MFFFITYSFLSLSLRSTPIFLLSQPCPLLLSLSVSVSPCPVSLCLCLCLSVSLSTPSPPLSSDCVGLWSLTSSVGNTLEATALKKMDFSSYSSNQMLTAPQPRVELWIHLPSLHTEIFFDLNFCWSCSCYCNAVISCVQLYLCVRETVNLVISTTSASYSLCIPTSEKLHESWGGR